jgi:hypothetical protein
VNWFARKLRVLATFTWDFVVGDDWRLALGVIAGLGLTALVAGLGVTAWWLLPAFAAAMLGGSVWRGSRAGR